MASRMMPCPNCGGQVKKGLMQCPACGQIVGWRYPGWEADRPEQPPAPRPAPADPGRYVCRYCAAEVPADLPRCPRCGERANHAGLPRFPEAAPPAQVLVACGSCGAEVIRGQEFCLHCGARGDQVLLRPFGPVPKARSGCLTAFLLVELALDAFGILGLFYVTLRERVYRIGQLPQFGNVVLASSVVEIACLLAVWRWKRWGVYGIVGLTLLNLVSYTQIGDALVNTFFGAVQLLVLAILVRPIWEQMD